MITDVSPRALRSRHLLMPLACACLLLAACDEPAPSLAGQLEWTTVDVPAPAAETLIALPVVEGDQVAVGQLLAQFDDRRARTALARAQAELAITESRLAELAHGARIETLDGARAAVRRAQAVVTESRREQARVAELRTRGLIADADLDRANSAARQADADLQVSQAQLQELTRGTRDEQLAQAESAVAAARAVVDGQRIELDRLSVHAPRAGRVDTLLLEVGEQPVNGATVVRLLVDDAPYARLYVPTSMRAALQPGQAFEITVEGIAQPLAGRLRQVAAEPSFTPYFALLGDDASRLMYRAEIALDPAAAAGLPAGLPLGARPVADRGQ